MKKKIRFFRNNFYKNKTGYIHCPTIVLSFGSNGFVITFFLWTLVVEPKTD